MKLLQFNYKDSDEIRLGILKGDKVIDVNKEDPSIPSTLIEVLKRGYVNKLKNLKPKSSVPLANVTLKAPVHGNDKVLCVGLNYKDHCAEQKLTPTERPFIFNKFPSTIVGPNDAVKLRNDVTQSVVFEVELTVVIGKKASRIEANDAYDYVLGYTIAQDIGAADWEKNENIEQLLLGKAMDSFCPLGPWIVTHDEIGDPQKLNVRSSLNGVQKQKSNTDQFIHKIPDVIARLSRVMTLLPGDIILTGTPGGVGVYRNPPEFLRPGDVIESEIEKIGTFSTKIEEF